MHALAYRALPFGTGKNQPNRAGWHGHARSPLRPYEALRRDRSTCFRSSRRSFLVIEPRSKDVETESYLANAVAFISGPQYPVQRPSGAMPCQPASWPSKPHAIRSTRRTSGHLDSGRLQSAGPIRSRCASDTWSKLRAHITGMPSSNDRITSVVRPRIVRVAGTTMISFNWSVTSFRARIRTGRRLSGRRNVYHRTSPRFNRHPPTHPQLGRRRHRPHRR